MTQEVSRAGCVGGAPIPHLGRNRHAPPPAGYGAFRALAASVPVGPELRVDEALTTLEPVDARHLLVRQLEVEHLEVGADALGRSRLRDGDDTGTLQHPPQADL